MDKPRRVIGYKELWARGIRISRSHIPRREKLGTFPKSFKLGDDHNSPKVWWEDEVDLWLENRAATR